MTNEAIRGVEEMMVQASSESLYRQAQEVIPGGVNSPVRSCRAVGTNPNTNLEAPPVALMP